MQRFLTTLALSSVCVGISPSLAAVRPSFYFPAENFCAIYQGSINSAKQFVLLLENEKQLTIQANSNLSISVTRQGKVVPPYQINSPTGKLISEHSYRTAKMGEHIVVVKGSTSEAKITLCLR
ncbi:MAG TPA: hypothetical protein DCF68_09845 [Cyanothece sp. UBA12306]|nr:hypothetical protein [Cyanothece sp. UBA12306]